MLEGVLIWVAVKVFKYVISSGFKGDKMSGIRRKSRELVYEGTILKVYKDYMENGDKEAVWDFIHHDGAAAVLAVAEDGKIIMVRQYRNALDRYTLELPAGKVDSIDEDRRLCAYRELREETGYSVDSPEDLEYLVTVDTMIAFCNEEVDIYVARNLNPCRQELDEDEEISLEFWSIDELMSEIYKGNIRDAKTVAALSAYAYKLRAGDC